MPDLIGQSLGRYYILEQLEEGGMLKVYKAYDTRQETDVAVKVIRTENILPSTGFHSARKMQEIKSFQAYNSENRGDIPSFGEAGVSKICGFFWRNLHDHSHYFHPRTTLA